MGTPAIAHFGTTIMEAPPPEGVEQRDAPIDGALAGNLEFLRILGFEPLIENFYAGVGRQYIWRRGQHGDIDYVEQDNFTSYSAKPRPEATGPREGDAIFRLTHREPVAVLRTLREKGLVTVDASAAQAFAAGTREWILVTSPAGQIYELGKTAPTAAGNHVVYVWTKDADLERTQAMYREHFGLQCVGTSDFHGIGKVTLLQREHPGATVGLLHGAVAGLSPRFSEDIFGEAGYPHFRLGAVDKAVTEKAAREAFPPGGDVSYVYFAESYLELVQG